MRTCPQAINGAQHLYPIFIIDPHFLKNSSYKCVAPFDSHKLSAFLPL